MISVFAPFSSKRVRALAYVSMVAATFYVQPVRPIMLVGFSMTPTFTDHEVVLAMQYHGQPIHRGDVVVVNTEDGPIIKRVAHLPGDIVEQVRSDGWTDDYTPQALTVSKRCGNYRRLKMPARSLYLRGDNPSVSIDSRQMGLFSYDDVEYILVNPRTKPADLAVTQWCVKYL